MGLWPRRIEGFRFVMNEHTIMQSKFPVLFCLVMTLCGFFASSCRLSQRDEGRELVNASGLSKAAVLNALNKGADVNKRSDTIFGWTPLISAIYHHKEEVIEVLLAHGANVNLGDNENRTPVVWAIEVWGDNTNLIRNLIEHGADPNKRNRSGSNAFDIARSQPNSAALLAI